MEIAVKFEAGTSSTKSVQDAQRLAEFLGRSGLYVTVGYSFNFTKVLVGATGLIYALNQDGTGATAFIEGL